MCVYVCKHYHNHFGFQIIKKICEVKWEQKAVDLDCHTKLSTCSYPCIRKAACCGSGMCRISLEQMCCVAANGYQSV